MGVVLANSETFGRKTRFKVIELDFVTVSVVSGVQCTQRAWAEIRGSRDTRDLELFQR